MKRLKLFWRVLGAMAVVTWIPLALLFFFIFGKVQSELESAAMREIDAQLGRTAEKIDAYLRVHLGVLETAAHLPAIVGSDDRLQAPLLAAIADSHGTFTVVKRIGPDGIDQARSDGDALQDVSGRAYFRAAMDGASEAYQTLISKTTGKPTLTMAVPVRSDGAIVGVVSGSVDLDRVAGYVSEARIGDTGFAWLADAENKVMAHPDLEMVREQASVDTHPALVRARGGEQGAFPFDDGDRRWLAAQSVLPQGWVLVVQIDESEALALAQKIERMSLLIAVACLAIAGVIAYVMARAITAPLVKVSALAECLAEGDLTIEQVVVDRGDEIGTLASTFNTMTSGLQATIRKIGRAQGKLKTVADTVGSRSQTVIQGVGEQRDVLDGAYASVDRVNGGIRKIVADVDALTESSEETSSAILEMASSLEEVRHHTDTLFSSVEQTASATEEMVSSIDEVDRNVDFLKNFVTDTSASMEEMNATIGQVRKSAAQSFDLSTNVSEAAAQGMQAVTETMEGMEKIRRSVREANVVVSQLGERSNEIGRILDVIDGIASQTNLLALNASILAAQAGEHGKGFSVVAAEIRDLSERTATSTKEIGILIHAVQGEVARALQSMGEEAASVDAGVQLAQDAGRALQRIIDSAQNSLDMGRDIADATREMAVGSESVTRSIDRVQEMVMQLNAATSQQAVGSAQILKAIERIREVARLVRQATFEQKTAADTISDAAASVIEMVREIADVTAVQAAESEKIVDTMERVRELAGENRDSATQMQATIGLLTDAIQELDGEVRRFRVNPGS